MKNLLAILLALSMLLLCACSVPDSSGNSSRSGGDNPDSSYTGSISQTESKEALESRSAAEEDPGNSADTTSVSDRDDKDQEESDPGTVKAPNQSQETTGKDKPKETLPCSHPVMTILHRALSRQRRQSLPRLQNHRLSRPKAKPKRPSLL